MLGSAILAGMNGPIAIPPASKADLTPGAELAHRLAALLGKPFSLTGKTRTDGANLRKTVGRVLEESTTLPIPAAEGAWRIVPPKKKGVPRLLREFADTYIVTFWHLIQPAGVESKPVRAYSANRVRRRIALAGERCPLHSCAR